VTPAPPRTERHAATITTATGVIYSAASAAKDEFICDLPGRLESKPISDCHSFRHWAENERRRVLQPFEQNFPKSEFFHKTSLDR
jgi:hypothetical protein